ncbi:SGNH/GDSL hydrolase family protein [Candidatus Peregrinibacteria bacterium]|nr:SGNH/GDSL hydrolase family protein [Candidatus Peregrinibacteria bacterium]
MSPENPKSNNEKKSSNSIFRNARFLMTLSVLAVLGSGCKEANSKELEVSDRDLVALKEDPTKDEGLVSIPISEPKKDIEIPQNKEMLDSDEIAEEDTESFEDLVKRVDKILKAGVPYQLEEKIDPVPKGRVYYVGDSYMVGITENAGSAVWRENVDAKLGRFLVTDGNSWVGSDIETEVTNAINNPQCKLLIINGGLNDFMNDDSEEALERVIDAYKRIIDKISERNTVDEGQFQAMIYDIPLIGRTGDGMSQLRFLARKLNIFLKEQSGFKLIETTPCVKEENRNKVHPKVVDYKNLFSQIEKYIRR